MVTMKQGGEWMELRVPHNEVVDILWWLKKYIQPHAIKFSGGIWDEINGWREKTLTSEYYNKFVEKIRNQPLIVFRKLMENSIYGKQQHLFQEMMKGDQWSDNHQDLISQRQASTQWGSLGLMRPPLNQLGAFLYGSGL